MKEKGIPVFDADGAAWEVEKAGSPCLRELTDAFGEGILTPEGELDRREMARRAFHDPGVLQQLNAIVHRAVEQKRDGFLAAHRQDPVVILDAPLLLECGWEKVTDTVWLVYLPEEEQIRRAMIRSGMTREEVTDRIRKQMSLEEKRKSPGGPGQPGQPGGPVSAGGQGTGTDPPLSLPDCCKERLKHHQQI